MNKTLQVIHFEVMRNLKKPSFWAAAILVPVLLGVYIGIAALAGYQAGESLEGGTDTSKTEYETEYGNNSFVPDSNTADLYSYSFVRNFPLNGTLIDSIVSLFFEFISPF